jgi:hypothetical protein
MTDTRDDSRRWLITRVDVLEAEIERLRGIEQFATEASRHERDGLRAEIERLNSILEDRMLLLRSAYAGNDKRDAEIARLRAALEDCIYGRRDWMEKAKAALEPKP